MFDGSYFCKYTLNPDSIRNDDALRSEHWLMMHTNYYINYIIFCTWVHTGSFMSHSHAGMSWIPLAGMSLICGKLICILNRFSLKPIFMLLVNKQHIKIKNFTSFQLFWSYDYLYFIKFLCYHFQWEIHLMFSELLRWRGYITKLL
jgi:hypothetical protein